MTAVERASKASSAEQANVEAVQVNEHFSKQTSEWPGTLRVDFIVIPPTVQW